MSIPIPCYFNSFGNQVLDNTFLSNGFFKNDTNGDLANAALPYPLNNCFRGNVNLQTGTPSSSPTNLPTACGAPWNPDTQQEYSLTLQLGCDSLGPASGACTGLTGHPYPLQTHVKLLPYSATYRHEQPLRRRANKQLVSAVAGLWNGR